MNYVNYITTKPINKCDIDYITSRNLICSTTNVALITIYSNFMKNLHCICIITYFKSLQIVSQKHRIIKKFYLHLFQI